MPDGEDVAWVLRVKVVVGNYMNCPGADDGVDDHPEEAAGNPLERIAGLLAPPEEVAVPEPEGDGQTDSVGMDL